jgi:hypothetical protein
VEHAQGCGAHPQAYEVRGQAIVLCPTACAALAGVGVTALEVGTRCE